MIITYDAALPKIKPAPRYKWKLEDANWEKFTCKVEESISAPEEYSEMSTNELEEELRRVIMEAANQHVGHKKIKPDDKVWMTAEVKEAIKRRNELRKNIAGNREEWIKASREVSEKIKEEKERRWKASGEDLERKTNPKVVWNTIRNMDGRRAPPNKNEVLEVDGLPTQKIAIRRNSLRKPIDRLRNYQ
jgi:hypothetical protein